MPTNLFLERNEYDSYPNVLVTLEGVRSPLMVTLDPDSISPDKDGRKYLKPGTLVCKRPDGLGTPLKATRLISGIASALTVEDAALFVPGDVLVIGEPYTRLTLSGVWANGDSASVILAGQSVSHAVAGFTTLSALAAAIAVTLSTSLLGSKAKFVAEGENIHVFGNHNFAIDTTETTAGTGALSSPDTDLQEHVVIGTVADINPLTQALTLTAPLVSPLPPQTPILCFTGTVLGMHVSTLLDIEKFPNDIALYTSCTVYGDRLPFWSDAIGRLLPEITLI